MLFALQSNVLGCNLTGDPKTILTIVGGTGSYLSLAPGIYVLTPTNYVKEIFQTDGYQEIWGFTVNKFSFLYDGLELLARQNGTAVSNNLSAAIIRYYYSSLSTGTQIPVIFYENIPGPIDGIIRDRLFFNSEIISLPGGDVTLSIQRACNWESNP